MTGSLSMLTTNLLALAAFVAVVVVALKVAQNIFGADTMKGAATEAAARVVTYPTGSSNALRRRFVKALVDQHVVMPSGERLAFAELTVRVAPEDLDRLDPEGDVERLGDDAALLYLKHAKREGWRTPDDVSVVVEVDPALRAGWIPPARGSGGIASRRPMDISRHDDEVGSTSQVPSLGWDVVNPPSALRAVPAAPTLAVSPARSAHDDHPTVNVAGDLTLRRGHQVAVVPRVVTVVLGRFQQSAVSFDEPQVSHRHCAIRLHAGAWQVMDLGSTNGTSVDGRKLEAERWTTLRHGAVLSLADVDVEVSTDSQGTVHLEGLTSSR